MVGRGSRGCEGGGMTVLRGRVVLTDQVLPDGVVEVDRDRIVFAGPTATYVEQHADVPLPGPSGTVLPGLVDVHCHGGGGHAVVTTDPAEATAVALHHRLRGTTTMLASLVTAPPAAMMAQVETLAPLARDGVFAGLHIEGPFLSHRRRGAQSAEHLLPPDKGLVDALLGAGNGAVKVMTLAPELPGAGEVLAQLRSAGVRVALGHSDAGYNEFRAALSALEGSGHVTHLANGMPPLHHRAPGPVAAAMASAAAGEATVELIVDGVHVADGFAELVFAAAAPGHVVLITDAMAAAGMADGDYDLGPRRVSVRDGVARLAGPSGDSAGQDDADEPRSIAGGTSHLLDVVRRVTTNTDVPLADAVAAASLTPARLLALDDEVGSLAAGKRADVLLVDDDLVLERVMLRGEWLT
jgi:N-acetylglucosamine-6-phosphate deacetylase